MKIRDDRSDVRTDIPQGPILGLIVFLNYVKIITKMNNYLGNIIWYADDTALILWGLSCQKVRKIAETNLQKYTYS